MPSEKPKPKRSRKRLAAATLGEVADAFAVTLDTVKRWRSEGMPGKQGDYLLHDVAAWLRTEGPWAPKTRPSLSLDDPLLTDGDSPALERYRLAKAKHAELDLEHRKGELIEREKCREGLGRWAVVIRRMGEKLAKRYGPDCAATINKALKECQVITEGAFGNDDA